jgi:hypothetical protein
VMVLMFTFLPPFYPNSVIVIPSFDESSLFLAAWKNPSILKSLSGSFKKVYSFDFSGRMKSVRIVFLRLN